jgi:hypothetical protein
MVFAAEGATSSAASRRPRINEDVRRAGQLEMQRGCCLDDIDCDYWESMVIAVQTRRVRENEYRVAFVLLAARQCKTVRRD